MTWVLDLDGVVWLADEPIAGSAEAIARLRDPDAADRRWPRVLQPYTVLVRQATAARPAVAALLRPVAGDLSEWAGGYDDAGLVLEPSGEEYIA